MNERPQIHLETDRLLLRRLTDSDEDDLVELDSDPEVMRWLTGGKPTPRDVIRTQLATHIDDYARLPGLGRWAAIEKSTGQFLGWMSLAHRNRSETGEAELGYRIRRSAWGKGYASEASRALVAKAFTDLGIERVYAETMAGNTASRRVMEKAGLTFSRTFHETFDEPIPGTELGEVEYAVNKADWGKRH